MSGPLARRSCNGRVTKAGITGVTGKGRLVDGGPPPAGGTLVPGLASRLPMEPIVVRPGVLVPDDALRFHAVRSSGPGGQNVNKVASKVELRVDLRLVTGLDDGA